MTCSKCGNHLPEGENFCTVCGNYCTPSRIIDAMHDIFSSRRLILAALLFTVAVFASLFLKAELSLLEIPIAVAMWMVVAAARDDKLHGYKTPLKVFSAVALIDTVLMWLIAGAFMIAGLLIMVFGDVCIDEISMLVIHIHGLEIMSVLIDPLSPFYSPEYHTLFYGIALFLGGIVQGVITRFIYTRIHHCASSALLSFKFGENRLEYLKLTKIVILVLAVLSLLTAVQNILLFGFFDIGGICAAAGEITVFALIGDLEKKIKIRLA